MVKGAGRRVQGKGAGAGSRVQGAGSHAEGPTGWCVVPPGEMCWLVGGGLSNATLGLCGAGCVWRSLQVGLRSFMILCSVPLSQWRPGLIIVACEFLWRFEIA